MENEEPQDKQYNHEAAEYPEKVPPAYVNVRLLRAVDRRRARKIRDERPGELCARTLVSDSNGYGHPEFKLTRAPTSWPIANHI